MACAHVGPCRLHSYAALYPRKTRVVPARAARDGEREVAAARVDERMRGPATAAVSAGLILGTLWAANSAEAAGAAWEATHYHANVVADVANEENFWANVFAYVRYFFSVLLGTAYIAVKPIQGMMKNPVSAVGVVIAGVLVVVGISWTLQAMVGLNDSFIYEPTSIVTNRPI